MRKPRKISERQQRFVDAYLVDPNATKAALAAGYSAKTARFQGAELLTNPNIAAALAAAREARAERVGVEADAVLEEIGTILRSDVSAFRFDHRTGKLQLRPGVSERAWRAVASSKAYRRKRRQKDGSVVVECGYTIRFWDKNAAIDKAMRHLSMGPERIDLHVSTVDEHLVALARRRASSNGRRGDVG